MQEHLAYKEMIDKVRQRMELSDIIYHVPRQLRPIPLSSRSTSQADDGSLELSEFPSTYSVQTVSDADDASVMTESSVERTVIPSRETKRVSHTASDARFTQLARACSRDDDASAEIAAIKEVHPRACH